MKNVKIGVKLIGGFLCSASITLILGLVGFWSLHQIDAASSKINNMQEIEKNLLVREIDHYKWVQNAGAFLSNESLTEVQVEKDDHKCGLGKFLFGEDRRHAEKIFPNFIPLFKSIEEPHEKLHGSAIDLESLLQDRSDRKKAVEYYEKELKTRLSNVQKKLLEFRTKIKEDSGGMLVEVIGIQVMSKYLFFTSILVGVLVSVAIGLWLTKSITKPITEVAKTADKISEGNINVDISYQSKDEIGMLANSFRMLIKYIIDKADIAKQISNKILTADVTIMSNDDVLGKALKTTMDTLHQEFSKIQKSIHELNAGSAQVSSASQSLSQGATEQASSIQEISSSLTEIGNQIRLNAESTSNAKQIAQVTREDSERGKEQVNATVSAMNEIYGSSQEISKIIKVIDDIAFQTNLLALNAAVEAARAGRHGKGFAVVAVEVRNLAGRSAKAAKETSELIERSAHKVKIGFEEAKKTAASFASIVENSLKLEKLVQVVATATSEQSSGIAQTSQGLSQIDQVTQQNTAAAEETASAAEELSSLAEELKAVVDQFQMKGEVKRNLKKSIE